MNTQNNNETTVCNDVNVNNTEENTICENNVNNETDQNIADDKKKSVLGKAAAGLGFGILLGGTSSFVISNSVHDDYNPEEENKPENEEAVTANDFDAIPVASSVNDEMSFSEAFSAARKEIGSGGVFEWRGNVYNTYYAEEWNAMSQEEKDEFVNHVRIDETETETETETQTEMEMEDVEIEIVDVDHGVDPDVVVAEHVDSNPLIEILGVEHDELTGFNYGAAVVDDQDVYLIDMNGDNEFDLIMSDLNHDNILSEDEVADISGYSISVDAFESVSNNDSYMDSNDEFIDNNDYDVM